MDLKNGTYEEWYDNRKPKTRAGILTMILVILGLSGTKMDKKI